MRVLFIGTHGQDNWGDELLLEVFLDQLAPAVDQFFVNSYQPERTRQKVSRHHVRTFHTRKQPLELLRALWRADAVVFGGGSIIKELYVAYGGNRYSTLQAVRLLATLAHGVLRKPVYPVNIGAGPIETPKGLRLARAIMKHATYTTVRDSSSHQLLATLKAKSPYQQVPDAIFSIDRSYLGLPARAQPRPIGSLADVNRVVVNVCRNISNPANWDYFLDQLARDLARLLQVAPHIQLVGLPMQAGTPTNDDRAALRELRERVLGHIPAARFTIAQPITAAELAAVIDAADLVIAERLHALILSVIVGTPFLALEYDIKVTATVSDLGLSRYGLDINQRFEPGAIFERLEHLAAHHTQVTQQLAELAARLHNAAQIGFDQLLQRLGHTPTKTKPAKRAIDA